ncbi:MULTISPECIES: sugar transferase [Streptococcus]|uniref:sugar transferase n=1 Tax=Streptococcus TaxID=1301 RepID=UPI00286EFDB0|nr:MULTISPECIES: sugar transferase [Streptococcus]MDV5118116.1 sugar transferase [Streptococcus pasteurianus]MDV5155957.1 sugar transferase [Streptococcus pasteurianus]MDV5164818.1 sugar transferase [Streptococcus pasteurianus]MDY5268546.1 sugar transferase [Streptococcus sp.]WOO56914.1 sugar transferase [Streptococcus pasteurianus]
MMEKDMYVKVGKRAIDFIIGVIALPFILLVTVVMAPLIYFNDKGPIFYNAARLGKNGKPFKMYKFRSMMVNAPDIRNEDGSTYNGDDDPRVTKVGRFMRKTSIDELPQFLNVFLGDMSLIGPRPDPLDDMEIYTEHQKKKLIVRPGITGYNQAYYRNSVEQNEKFENDVYYAENISFILDVKIFFKTIATVLTHDNVYNDASDLSEREMNRVQGMRNKNE